MLGATTVLLAASSTAFTLSPAPFTPASAAPRLASHPTALLDLVAHDPASAIDAAHAAAAGVVPTTDLLALLPWEVPYEGSYYAADESKKTLTGIFDDYTILGLLAIGFPTAVTIAMYGSNPTSEGDD